MCYTFCDRHAWNPQGACNLARASHVDVDVVSPGDRSPPETERHYISLIETGRTEY
jgi:hypothetical protein